LLLAQRNLRRSRGDRKGAFRLGFFLIVLTFCLRVFRVDHVWEITAEGQLIGLLLGEALGAGVAMAVVYLAFEPYFRRRWPRVADGWRRWIAGRFRDPMIGRDALIGVAAGTTAGIL